MYKIKRKVKIDGKVRTVHCMVIPEKKMVIARLRGCELDAIHAFVMDTGFAPLNPERFMMNDTYEATASCHPEDEFVAEVGCDVAVEKLGENYTRARKRKQKMMKHFIKEHLTDARYKPKAVKE